MRNRDRGQLLRGTIDSLLLACLEDGPAHGYRIIELMRERSDGVFELAEGTVYPALHRLERDGYVASAWSTSSSQRRRRTYELSDRGRRVLAERRSEWRAYSDAVTSVLLKRETWPSAT